MTKKNNPVRVSLRLWLIALAAMLALTGMAASVTQTKTSADSIDNFGKVNEHYYRGSQPRAEGFARLKRLGVKTVIDLRKDNESEEPEWVRAAGMQYFNIPLKASQPATEEQTDYFLKLVNDPNNWPVYVHCKGGRHRTGALTAIYRITHDGWTADQAYEEMKKYDFDQGFFGGPAAQKRYVYSFYQRHGTAGGQKVK
ncbi:MAG: tyrosine-protein phosphatase [Acidobacteriota bacterium]|jgi:protein tyrosine/serine phosphatase|nr:tyrosine-protein phosphatase [Acidobacteriota bacterium]